MEGMLQAISTVGFPIVAVVCVAWFFYKFWFTQEERNAKREEELMKLIRELSTNLADLGRIVDKNTEVVAVLSERVSILEEEIRGE